MAVDVVTEIEILRPRDEVSSSMMLRNRGEPSGFAAVTAPVMAAAMKRANQSDLRRLKAVLEDSASSAET